MEVDAGRLDAGVGAYLKGNGKGQFTWINNLQTGLWAPYDARDLALLSGPQEKIRILISNNNQLAQIFEENK